MRLASIIFALPLVLGTILCCENNPQPDAGKMYIKTDKGLNLPTPNPKDSSKFVYTNISVSFESDGVYLKAKEMLRNCLMCVLFDSPQQWSILSGGLSRTNVELSFKDEVKGWYVYMAPYEDFHEYARHWTWSNVDAIRFLYEPESLKQIVLSFDDYNSIEEYYAALREKRGPYYFDYDVTIYRRCEDAPALIDSDFDEVFKLFRAHTN